MGNLQAAPHGAGAILGYPFRRCGRRQGQGRESWEVRFKDSVPPSPPRSRRYLSVACGHVRKARRGSAAVADCAG